MRHKKVKLWLLWLSLTFILINCSLFGFSRSGTDQDIVYDIFGRNVHVKYDNQRRVTHLACPNYVRGPIEEEIILLFNISTTCKLEPSRLPEIGQLTELQGLVIDRLDSPLTTLPSEIGQLTHLEGLTIEGDLTTLPPEIWLLTNLKYLDLYGNNLTTLPGDVGQLTKLRELRLAGNNITALPEEIGRLTNLQIMYLGGNELTTLPLSIG